MCHPGLTECNPLCYMQVAKKTVEACRSYLDLPHFNKEIIFNKSRAAAGLCEWAINIVKYYDVVSEVEPKRQELAAANAKLHEANTTLAAVQQKVRLPASVVVCHEGAQEQSAAWASFRMELTSTDIHNCCLAVTLQVAELNAKVQELEAQFNAAVEDKEAAIRESERCQLKLQLANRLINALASEGGWDCALATLQWLHAPVMPDQAVMLCRRALGQDC